MMSELKSEEMSAILFQIFAKIPRIITIGCTSCLTFLQMIFISKVSSIFITDSGLFYKVFEIYFNFYDF